MKQASLILNIVLLLAVGYLFFAHFSGRVGVEAPAEAAADQAAADIVYINTDSLLVKYEYFRQKQEALAQREQEADADLQARSQTLQREIQQAQQRAQSGDLAPRDIQRMQQELGMKQQQLMQDQEQIAQSLVQESQVLQQELQSKVKELLTDLRWEKGYDYILSYGPGTGVLMVNDSLDITSLVVDRLNATTPTE